MKHLLAVLALSLATLSPAAHAGEKSKKPAAKPTPNVTNAGTVTEGTFSGVDNGDYFHFKLKPAKGAELSLFVIQSTPALDKVLENPAPYLGKKCRVTWKKTTENIPEAGGKIEIDKLISVEWVDKK